ncbi:hypothetical protein [Nocardia stercoris]|uniref:Recombinase family protein n=1 Tax=Nocardia stercoris TaxID=2483361 RepID=A0A3M2KZM8_9NOCA|nr:hypothetical protein [Nocardia stercoris]RMI30116.1 hypothetical protein EBN03_23100 [Nocardia stercoris]
MSYAFTCIPLAYGYVRTDLVAPQRLAETVARLTAAAADHGHELATVFYEDSPQSAALPEAFAELTIECRRSGAHTVFTLPGHLGGMAIPRICLLDFLAARGNAHVWELSS